MPDSYLSPLRDDKRGRVPRRPHYSRTFYQFLPTPPSTPDIGKARAYLGAINRLVDKGGWTRGEWVGLRRLQKRWERRVSGEDPRWTMVGAKSGRLPSVIEQALRPEPDPIFAAPLKGGK